MLMTFLVAQDADELEDELNAALARRPDLHVQFAADGDAQGGYPPRTPQAAFTSAM